MVVRLVRAGFSYREIVDELRPGRPLPGWTIAEVIYWHRAVIEVDEEQRTITRIERTEDTYAASAAAQGLSGNHKRAGSRKLGNIVDKHQKELRKILGTP